MSAAEAFFDTNVVLYLLSADSEKADRAEAMLIDGGVVSVQVLNEIANVTRRKLGMSWPEVGEILTQLHAVCRIEPLSVATQKRGIGIAERYDLSVYDAMILASAVDAGCSVVYTEDLQDGQTIDGGVTVVNPFAYLRTD